MVKYLAEAQRFLPLHTDQSTLSLTIALNDPDSTGSSEDPALPEEATEVMPNSVAGFEGGGTYFESLARTLSPPAGGVVSFPGDVSHGGRPITRGTRYIIAVFLCVL